MNAIFRRLDALATNMLPADERSADVLRKRQLRSAAAEVFIPPVVDPERKARCLADPVLFLRTYNPTGDKGFTTPFAPHHLRMIEAIHERAVSGGDKAVAAPRGDGKAVSLDTVIPTPGGFKTMGQIEVGDKVFDKDGIPCNVVFTSNIQYGNDCYRVEFADGDSVIADGEHQWLVNKRWAKDQRIYTTRQMIDAGLDVGREDGWFDCRFSVDVAGCVEFPHRSLPIDPYLLGVWLGDGSSSGNIITSHISDAGHYIDEFDKVGVAASVRGRKGNTVQIVFGRGSAYSTDRHAELCNARDVASSSSVMQLAKTIPSVTYCTLLEIRTGRKKIRPVSYCVKLRELGVLSNKHIPVEYLCGFREQRLALLQGLMDTDGSISKRGQCEFSNKNDNIINGVCRLVSSLGMKCGRITKKVIKGETYKRVTFTPTQNVFRLKRKSDRFVLTGSKCLTTKAIVSINKVNSVPVKCIQVDSPSRTYLCGNRFTVTHNTTVAEWMAIYIILAGLIRSLIIIGATGKHARKIFKNIKNAFSRNQLLAEDFPEICACVRELDGAPQRAGKQHVQNQLTHIVWTQDDIEFPHVPGSNYGGARIAYSGLDAAIRGGRFEFALIDDPETKEVARNEESNQKVEELIDGDVAGLAFPNSSISRVVLTTIQNRRCYSYRVTDPKTKPAFGGERYGMLTKWPERRDMWDEYIAKRQMAQADGDKDGLVALQFFLDNREEMERGSIVTNPHRFNHRVNSDGVAVEVCALQSFFNRVADWGLPRVLAELQNDPEEEEVEQSLALTAGKVQSRISGLKQNELPREDGVKIVVGMDVGNRSSHWVKVAFFGNATGVIIDYGVMETANMVKDPTQEFVTEKLLPAMFDWRTNILTENPPDFALIDSGSGMHKEAVYEFIRQAGGSPFAASKGWDGGRFRMGKEGEERRAFLECYASLQAADRLWLYNVNTEYWKHWVHERFATPTFDPAMQFTDGSLSLFSAPNNPKEHLSFAQHIIAEELQELFVEGKGLQRRWVPKSKNNHWLDAMALASAAAACLGVRLVRKVSIEEMDRAAKIQEQKILKNTRMGVVNRFTTPDGRPFLATERQ